MVSSSDADSASEDAGDLALFMACGEQNMQSCGHRHLYDRPQAPVRVSACIWVKWRTLSVSGTSLRYETRWSPVGAGRDGITRGGSIYLAMGPRRGREEPPRFGRASLEIDRA